MRASAILDPALEQQDAAARRANLSARLRETVAHAYARAPHVRRSFEKAGISSRDIESLDDLAKIPITRKDDLPALQANDPPFGGLLAVEPALLQRIFASPDRSSTRRVRARTSGAFAWLSVPRGSGAETSSSIPPPTT